MIEKSKVTSTTQRLILQLVVVALSATMFFLRLCLLFTLSAFIWFLYYEIYLFASSFEDNPNDLTVINVSKNVNLFMTPVGKFVETQKLNVEKKIVKLNSARWKI